MEEDIQQYIEWLSQSGFVAKIINNSITEQYLLMKINLIQTIIAGWLGLLVSCLHLQQQPRIYDPDQYLNSLQQTQDQLRNDLQNIQQQFQQLDEAIKAAAYDANEQLRLYQQGIADERDSLYQIEQYLALPFNQRACKCFNFSDELRQNLTKQIDAVSQSLSKVESKAKECLDCQMNIEIGSEIKYQRNYLKIMQDTIDAKCCKVYTILYADNLNATNWLYGKLSQAEYNAWIANKIKQATVNDTLVRKCPVYAPYVMSDLKNCTNCENSLFNLSSRQCVNCPIGKIFNYEKHTCDYDVICPAGSQFNQETVTCQKVEPAYNNSLCPPQAPVWNPQVLGCFRCSKDTPYYDININKCTTCPDNYTYNINTNQCVHNECQPGQTYNSLNKRCQTKPGTTTVQYSSSNCPTDRPYWDKNSLSCGRCPINLPFYNVSSKNCQVCPPSSVYDSTRNLCTVQCPANQKLNPSSLKCQNVTQVTPNNDGTQISLCPPSRPIWNAQTKSCSQCRLDTPYWNDQLSKCDKCPSGLNWNNATSKCESTTTISCQQGFKLNLSTLKCQKITGMLAFCPPQKPYYNSVIMACTQCPADKPNYVPQTNECKSSSVAPVQNTTNDTVTCPQGFTYDTISKSCKPNSVNSNQTIAVCPPQTPLWDVNQGICVPCPAGQQWNAISKLCVNCADPSKCNQQAPITPINTTCSFNSEWNSSLGQCVRCLSYQKYNSQTKRCQNFCKPGQVYNSNYDICSTTISKCPIGLRFNESKLRCQCAQGNNYRYNKDTQACQQFCQPNQYYSYLDEQCHSL